MIIVTFPRELCFHNKVSWTLHEILKKFRKRKREIKTDRYPKDTERKKMEQEYMWKTTNNGKHRRAKERKGNRERNRGKMWSHVNLNVGSFIPTIFSEAEY